MINLLSPEQVKQLLARHNAKPSKMMGQNFLIDAEALSKVVATAELSKTDTILEVGPGIGTLTRELAASAGKVVSVEKDQDMIEILKETLQGHTNVQVLADNILTWNPENYGLKEKSYKLVSNIPYYLTSPLIRKFLEEAPQPKTIVLMVQKEVAERICAAPPDMSILAVSVQFYATPEIVAQVPKESFYPVPKVDSAIIKITPFAEKPKMPATPFFRVVKAGFSSPRKQLANNLSASLKKTKEEVNAWLTQNSIAPNQRAETLTVQDWTRLANSM